MKNYTVEGAKDLKTLEEITEKISKIISGEDLGCVKLHSYSSLNYWQGHQNLFQFSYGNIVIEGIDDHIKISSQNFSLFMFGEISVESSEEENGIIITLSDKNSNSLEIYLKKRIVVAYFPEEK